MHKFKTQRLETHKLDSEKKGIRGNEHETEIGYESSVYMDYRQAKK